MRSWSVRPRSATTTRDCWSVRPTDGTSASDAGCADDSPENAAFLKAYAAANDPKLGKPNFMTVGGYDAMAAIFEIAKKLNGNIDPDKYPFGLAELFELSVSDQAL